MLLSEAFVPSRWSGKLGRNTAATAVGSKSFQMRLAEINNQVNRPYMLRDRVCDTVEGMSSQGPKVGGKKRE